ncbi:hypothetical protein M0R45_036819 [Rubus argutus]|uniref:Uncharacterized protein n=1 Tax=Rubus argutus TaxID=59490 RepID=A0AAW1VYX2_RUBAR
MGYLSCKAESAISVSNSQTPSSNEKTHQDPTLRLHHGYVYKAVLRGRLVAVKRPSRAHSQIPRPTSISGPETTNEVDNEIEILSKIHSPRLVNLLGFLQRFERQAFGGGVHEQRFGILLLEIISGRKAIDVGYSPPSIVDWAIPLIKRGKLVTVYDPRIMPPKDPIVRKQLAVICRQVCVRNNFNNPCTMVETMGQPVESRASHFNSKPHGFGEENFEGMEAKLARQALRNSRRVYSDLGFSSNLMELMAGTD